jgi:UDP-N-acetylglucosamine transferase subunit ALG13
MARIVVTVGMGPWPFDRLLEAVAPLCGEHDVFVQTGTSALRPPCRHAAFVPLDELQRRLAEADLVITHAGNTVRLVQRLGRVPIAVARTAALGEMGNDHQVLYLREEEPAGRVHAVWDVAALAEAVATHDEVERRLLARPLPPAVSDERLVELLDGLCERLVR